MPASEFPGHRKYRPDLDGLRVIAVGSVVAFFTFPNFFKGGFGGVDIFLVILGYLIAGLARRWTLPIGI
jgi:peptidoglycan/LPS O-acetylase OafA/YrhL